MNLEVGKQVKFANDRFWWNILAADDRFTICVRFHEFHPGNYLYTIVDKERNLRGPCNLVGQGWDFNGDTLKEDAELLLKALQAGAEVKTGDGPWEITETEVEVSHRNNVEINILGVR